MDEVLITRLKNSDQEAFVQMIHQYQSRVFSVALGILRQREDALDVSQETFLKAYKSIKSWRGDCSLSTWLCTIASNTATDFLRKRRDIQPLEGQELGAAPDSWQPEAVFSRKVEQDSVRQAVASLPWEYRQLIVLRHSGDMSCQEIAEATGLSLSQVKNRLLRARQMLRGTLTESDREVRSNA